MISISNLVCMPLDMTEDSDSAIIRSLGILLFVLWTPVSMTILFFWICLVYLPSLIIEVFEEDEY